MNTGSCREPNLRGTPVPFPRGNPVRTSGYNAPAAGDLDGDGDIDFLVGVIGGAYVPNRTSVENMYLIEQVAQGRYEVKTSRFLSMIDVGSESVPVLLDTDGVRFMPAVHPQAELAPRDVVAHAIVRRMAETGSDHVFLDARHLGADFLRHRFPTIHERLLAEGIDLTTDLVPVAPAQHYHSGGVLTDLDGRTTVPGLYAAGEVACTGVHGANRLASNSLLEGLVFAVRAADALGAPRPDRVRLRGDATLDVETVTDAADATRASRQDRTGGNAHRTDTAHVRQTVQSVMTDRVGLLRDATGLASARRDLDALGVPAPVGVREHEDRALLDLARLTARAAEARTESRGAHARTDHPDTDPRAARPNGWVLRPAAVRQEVPA